MKKKLGKISLHPSRFRRQLHQRIIRWFKPLAWLLAILFFILYLLPLILINIPSVQHWMAKESSSYLSRTLKTEVRLDKVYIASLGRIGLSGVEIKDQQDKPLLQAKRLEGGLDWIQLIKTGEITIRSARLFDGYINLYHLKDQRLNADFIITLLKGDPNHPSKTRLRINTIIIRNTSLSYIPLDKRRKYLAKNLNLKVRKLRIYPHNISGELRHMSFNLNRDLFEVRDFAGRFSLVDQILKLNDVALSLPHSHLNLPLLEMNLGEKNSGVPTFSFDNLTANITPSDLKGWFEPLSEFDDLCSLTLKGQVKKDKILLNDLSINYPNFNLSIEDLSSRSIPRSKDTLSSLLSHNGLSLGNLSLQINRSLFHKITAELIPYRISQHLSPLGFIDFKCHVDEGRSASQYKFYTELLTGLGKLSGDIDLAFSPKNLYPSAIDGMLNIDNKSILSYTPYGSQPLLLDATIKVAAKHSDHTLIKQVPYRGHLDVSIRNGIYKYLNINDATINLTSDNLGYKALVICKQPNVQANLSYSMHQKQPQLDFDIESSEFALNKFEKLPEWLRKTTCSFNAQGYINDFLSIDKIGGQVSLSKMLFKLPKEEKLDLAPIDAYLLREGRGLSMGVNSPYLSALVKGSFPLNELPAYFTSALTKALPQGLIKSKFPHALSPNAQFQADVHVGKHLAILEKYINMPLQFVSDIDLYTHYKSPSLLDVNIKMDSVRRGSLCFHNLKALLKVNDHKAALQCQGDIQHKDSLTSKDWKISLLSDSDKDIVGKIDLGYRPGNKDNGHIIAKAQYTNPNNKPQWNIQIDKSRFYLNNIYWDLEPSEVDIIGGEVKVSALQLKAPGRGLYVQGKLGHNPDDRLNIKLNHIDLLYALSAAGVSFDILQTELTGEASISDVYGEQIMEANLTSEAFKVNGRDVGAIECHGNWEKNTQQIVLTATVTQDSARYADVSGFIKPVGKDAGLRLNFDAHDLKIDFIDYWLSGFCSKFSGNATGLIRLVGPFSCLGLEGEAETRNLQFGIDYTNVVYTLNGRAKFTPVSMDFTDFEVKDQEGHKGQFNGHVGYKGFDNFVYSLQADNLNDLQVYNVTKAKNNFIYGAAYASGKASLIGSEHDFTLRGSLTADKGSDMTLNFMKPTVSSKTGLMKFIDFDAPASTKDSTSKQSEQSASSMPITISLQLDITPKAKVKLVLDDANSDGIVATTEGNLKIDYNSEAETDVYGKLSLLDGTYQFNFQNIIRKNFDLEKGSKILFYGDPMDATINLKANYKLTTNLADLDESFNTLSQNTSSVPLLCVLEVDGAIKRPDVGFNIVLPSSDAELQRRVHAFINTEDEMSKQVAYLIMTGRFNSVNNLNASDNTADIAASAAATNLSDQLSYILSKFGSNFRFGTMIKTPTGQYANTDMELLMSGSLFDNRLKVNGNFGYRENPMLKGTYVGEFDAEYSLNKSGSIILKAYNHYNNMYQYLKQSSSTWGFGIMYKKDFDSFIELFPKPMRKWFRNENRSKSKQKETIIYK